MTNDKELTPEQKEEVRKGAVKNLESKLFQKVVGSNLVLSSPYEFGSVAMNGGQQTYGELGSDAEFNAIGEKSVKAQREEYRNAQIYGEPARPSTADISYQVKRIVESSKSQLCLGDLEESVLKVGAKLKFKVPEKMKKLSVQEIYARLSKEKREKPSDEERDVLNMYTLLGKAYDTQCAVAGIDYFGEINALGKEIEEKYADKKKA